MNSLDDQNVVISLSCFGSSLGVKESGQYICHKINVVENNTKIYNFLIEFCGKKYLFFIEFFRKIEGWPQSNKHWL